MQINPMEEWQRLTEVYREKYDEELLELAADSADLTEVAQQVLRDEMKKRGLELPRAAAVPQKQPDRAAELRQEPAADPADTEDAEQDNEFPREFTWKTLLCRCGEREQALQICEMLRRAGIERWLGNPSSRFASMEISGHEIFVPADQLEQAQVIAAQPVPQDIVDQSKESTPEYELPVCPKCGAADPVLESADPVNSWHCEACENDWSDPAEGLGQNPE
jgi:hypothetical protein